MSLRYTHWLVTFVAIFVANISVAFSQTAITAKHSGLHLEAKSRDLIQNTPRSVGSQLFSLKSIGNGWYRIISQGRCLTLRNNSSADGAHFAFNACGSARAQLFSLEVLGDGYRRIHTNNGKCIDVDSASTVPGHSLIQWGCHDGDNQRFAFGDIAPPQATPSPTPEPPPVVQQPPPATERPPPGEPPANPAPVVTMPGDFNMVVKWSGLNLEILGSSLVQDTKSGSPAQVFNFADVGNGRYFIRSSGKCVAVRGGSTSNGAQYDLVGCANDQSQYFSLSKQSDGYLEIRTFADKCVDVDGASKDPGHILIQWDCHGGDNQRFAIAAASQPISQPAPDPAPPQNRPPQVDVPPVQQPPPSFGNGVAAVSADFFLSSLGINTHIDQGVSGQSTVEPLRYLGVRAIRDGSRGVDQYLLVHNQTGVKVDVLTGLDLNTARTLAQNGALLSVEGPNEPNNFPITYNGQQGGGQGSWMPVALFQRDLYATVKNDSVLRDVPVFHVSEGGAEVDNVGLQWLTIPDGAGTTMPTGTRYADYANTHNYVSSTQRGLYTDNQAWSAADPQLDGPWDGMMVEYHRTWHGGFTGYSADQIPGLPKVSTETGWDSASDPGGEYVQGVVLVNTYLSYFKRGWRYTFIYMLRDGEGGDGNQGVFRNDSTPKLAAQYIHNLTSVLADNGQVSNPGRLDYSISNQTSTVHDLLIQKSDRKFELVVWGERVNGSDGVSVNLGGNHRAVNVYDVTSSTSPVQSLSNANSVQLNIGDHAMIVEIID